MATGTSGWLRKCPTYAGGWSRRFFVLSQEDSTIRVYANEDCSVTPTHTYVLPKGLLVSEPFEKLVIISPATRTKAKAYVFKIWKSGGEDVDCVVTCGAISMEEAMRWKLAIESLSASPHLPVSKPSKPKFVLPAYLSESADDESKWKVVDTTKDGVVVEGETKFTNEFPSIRARVTIQATPKQVFQTIMKPQQGGVLKEISSTSDICYMQLGEIWLGPIKTGARDFLLLRYWREDEEEEGDGMFVITMQSVEDQELGAMREGFVRGRVFAMGFAISPLNGGDEALVKIFCHADPGAPLNHMPSLVLQNWMLTFVGLLTGVKHQLETPTATLNDGESVVQLDELDSTKNLLEEDDNDGVVASPFKLGSFRHSEWMETPQGSEPYTLRGKTYLQDKIKYKCHDNQFQVVAADLFKLNSPPMAHCAARSDSPLHLIRQQFPNRFVFVFQFMLPGPPFYSLSVYAVAKPGVLDDVDQPFAKLWCDFVDGTDEYRASVFKMIPRVTQGSYMVKKTVGEIPALIARKMKMNFYVNRDYVECDMDLGTSAVAGSILSIVKGYATTLTVDLGFLLEGQSVDRLPEIIVCGFRMVKPNMAKAILLGEDPNPLQTEKNLRDYEMYRQHGSNGDN
ncbi:hypothetical protein BASA81_008709 [Batrachochytrium salamandrivorans]|nr:hypothetical protein BASA81_008709 [Batrachochytrium salamandrivorans]